MPITVPTKVSGGAPEGSRLLNRVARPLNGLEVAAALKTHIEELANKLLQSQALKPELIESTISHLAEAVDQRIATQTRLQKNHICYPKVGWSVKVRLERLDDAGLDYHLNAECELDLERNIRLLLQFGESGRGEIVKVLEDERLSSDKPDEIREQFDMPIKAEFMNPSGEVVTADLRDLRKEEPRRAARTIDVGSAKPPEAMATVGEVIITPAELPEVTLDLEPPKLDKAPSNVPAPAPGGMSKTSRPNASFKGVRK